MEWHTPEHGGRQTLVPAGSLSLVPARANIRWQRDRPSKFLLIALEPKFMADAAGYGEEITWNWCRCSRIRWSATYSLHCGRRFAKVVPRAAPTALHCARPSLSIWCSVMQPPRVPRGVRKGGLSPDRLRRVLDHIEGHLSDGITQTQLAEVARLSSAHFSAQFRRSTGFRHIATCCSGKSARQGAAHGRRYVVGRDQLCPGLS